MAEMIGQVKDKNGKCKCTRCGKKMSEENFFTYKDGSKTEICKLCLTAYVDNFDPNTFEWILEKMDVPYVPNEWNVIRDKAFAKDPYKMNGASVLGKYLAKMKLKQWMDYGYKDTEAIQAEMEDIKNKKEQADKEEKQRYQAELKVKLKTGKITAAQYQTLVSTETQNKQLAKHLAAAPVAGQDISAMFAVTKPGSYEQALQQAANPFNEQDFLLESELEGINSNLTQEDKIYLGMKWGRLYKPNQWVALEQLYNQFMNSFDIQGAARIDTLKMICKTSLKMNQAIDSGDIQAYQRLSRVYDSLMKSAKFTEAQNKDKDGSAIDSASAIVDFVQANSGYIPKFKCEQPQDLIDKIIFDLKDYTRNLIYEDKSLAQEIEQYLKEKRIAEEMKKDKEEAQKRGLSKKELQDDDLTTFKDQLERMKQQDIQNEIKLSNQEGNKE